MAPTTSQPTRVVVHNRLATSVLVGQQCGGPSQAKVSVAPGRVSFAPLDMQPIDLRTSHRLYLALIQVHGASISSTDAFEVEFLPTKREDTVRAARRTATVASAVDAPGLTWAPSKLHAHPSEPFKSMVVSA